MKSSDINTEMRAGKNCISDVNQLHNQTVARRHQRAYNTMPGEAMSQATGFEKGTPISLQQDVLGCVQPSKSDPSGKESELMDNGPKYCQLKKISHETQKMKALELDTNIIELPRMMAVMKGIEKCLKSTSRRVDVQNLVEITGQLELNSVKENSAK